jgi:hypothetical protein
MRPLAGWFTALSLMCNLTVPVHAESGAKGLFFEQLDHPTSQMNTGVQYWIELRRDGVTSEANNKTEFKSGDKIRFHVKPNINGFAYILLKSGSQGEQAQLFPDAKRKENNQIARGKEIVLPNDGVLTFDSNPGTEKLCLVISRHAINTDTYLSKESSAPRIAMSSSGSKDLIPNQVLVSYISPASVSKLSRPDVKSSSGKVVSEVETKPVHATGPKMVKVKTTSDSPKIASSTPAVPKPVVAETSSPAPDKVHAKHSASAGTSASAAAPVAKHASSPPKKIAAEPHDNPPVAAQQSVVTVVNTDPNAVFVADISLEHL